MALPTNTFSSYTAIGNREDLSDVIYRIDPADTPFMSAVEREKASAGNHEWQTQALASVADPSAADGTGTRTDGTQRLFTEANLKTVLQSVWNNGGKPDVVMTGGFNKQQFSTFTGRATPTEDTKAKKIVAAVDAYESD